MKTLIKENTWLGMMAHGWGNGYVLIPKGHSLHGVHYDDINVDVHGGLTFAALVEEETLSHWPELSKNDVGKWMVGFDTAHYQDTQENWPKEKVQQEADNLLKQLQAL